LPSALHAALGAAQCKTGCEALFANMLMHGSGRMPGGATFFALFGMPFRPGPRHAYFLQLLLPHLHFAYLRMAAPGAAVATAPGEIARAISQREVEILQWVRDGKSNEEVGRILGISGLTVKNHLQRIYKTLGVSNRAQAVARAIALRVLPVSGALH
jgi:DNA-binding CsgD family transcriptional regulator